MKPLAFVSIIEIRKKKQGSYLYSANIMKQLKIKIRIPLLKS